MRKKLGEILVEQGATTPDKVKRGLGYQRQWGGKIGRILVEMKLVSEEQLARALAAQSRMSLVKIKAEIADSVAALVPQELGEKHEAIAFGIRTVDKAETVYVAIADPYNVTGMDEIRFRIGKTVKFALAPADEIKRAQARARGEVIVGEVIVEAELPVEMPEPPAKPAASAPLGVSGDPLADLFAPPQPASAPVSELDELLGLLTPPPPSASSALDDLFSLDVAAPKPVSPPAASLPPAPALSPAPPVVQFGPGRAASPIPQPPVLSAARPIGPSAPGTGLEPLVAAPADQGLVLDHSSPAEALATLASGGLPASDSGFVLDHSSPAETLSSLVAPLAGGLGIEASGEEPLQLESGADAAAALTLGLAIDESAVVAANAPELELTEADAVPSFELTADDMAADAQSPAEIDALQIGTIDESPVGAASILGSGPALNGPPAVAVRIEPLGGEEIELDASSIQPGFDGLSEDLALSVEAAASGNDPLFGTADDLSGGVAADGAPGLGLDGATVEEPVGVQPEPGTGFDLAPGVAGEDLDIGLGAESLFGEEIAAQPLAPVSDGAGGATAADWAQPIIGQPEAAPAASPAEAEPAAPIGGTDSPLVVEEASAEAHDDVDALDISLDDDAAEPSDSASAEGAAEGAGLDVTLAEDEQEREDLPFDVEAEDGPGAREALPEPEESLDISIAEEESPPQNAVVSGEGDAGREPAATPPEATEALGASLGEPEPSIIVAEGLLAGEGPDVAVSETSAPEGVEVEAELASEGLGLSVSEEQAPVAVEADASLADPTLGPSILDEQPGAHEAAAEPADEGLGLLASGELEPAPMEPEPSLPEDGPGLSALEEPAPAAVGIEDGLFGEGLDLSAPEDPTLDAAEPEADPSAEGLGLSAPTVPSPEAWGLESAPMAEVQALELSEAPAPEAAAVESQSADGLDVALPDPLSDPLAGLTSDGADVLAVETDQEAEGQGLMLSQDLGQEAAAIEPDLAAESLGFAPSEDLSPESPALESAAAAEELNLSNAGEPAAETAEPELDPTAKGAQLAPSEGVSIEAIESDATNAVASSVDEQAMEARPAVEGNDLAFSDESPRGDVAADTIATAQGLQQLPAPDDLFAAADERGDAPAVLPEGEVSLAGAEDAAGVASAEESLAIGGEGFEDAGASDAADVATAGPEVADARDGLAAGEVEEPAAEAVGQAENADFSQLEASATEEASVSEADEGFPAGAGVTEDQALASDLGFGSASAEEAGLEQLNAGLEGESQQVSEALEAGESERDSVVSEAGLSAEPGDAPVATGEPELDALGDEPVLTPADGIEESAAWSSGLAQDGEQPLAELVSENGAEGVGDEASLAPSEAAEADGWSSMSPADVEDGALGLSVDEPSVSEASSTAEAFSDPEPWAGEPDGAGSVANEVDPWSAAGATDAPSQGPEHDSPPSDFADALAGEDPAGSEAFESATSCPAPEPLEPAADAPTEGELGPDADDLSVQAAEPGFEPAAEPSEPDAAALSDEAENALETSEQALSSAPELSEPVADDSTASLDWGAQPDALGSEGASPSFEGSPANDAQPAACAPAPQAGLDDEIEIPLVDGASEPAPSVSTAPAPEDAPAAAPDAASDFELAVLAGLKCVAEGRVGEGRPIPVDRLGRVTVKLLLEKGAITSDDLIQMLAVSPEKFSTLIVKLLLNLKLIGPDDLVSMLAIPPDRLNATLLLILIERGVFDPSSVVRALG
ncbi:MAG: hypothetical protein ACOX6T_14810 [Myxococcales bacterium]